MKISARGTIMAMLILFASAKLLCWTMLALSCVPETGGMSVNILYGIQHLITTGDLYNNPEAPPFSIIQYMPLHYRLAAFITRVFTTASVHDTMVVNRLLCLFAALLTAVISGHAVKKLFPGQGNSAIIVALLSFIIIPGINFSRLDNVYLMFNTAAFTSFLFYLKADEKKIKWILYTALFCALALLTKQTAVLLIGLIGIWLLLHKKIKPLLVFSISIIMLVISGILLMKGSSLLFFKMNVVDGLKNGISMIWFYNVILKYYFLRFGIFIVFAIYISVRKLWMRQENMAKFIGASVIYYFFMATVLCLKAGSGYNYYMEFMLCFFFGLAFLMNVQSYNKTTILITAIYLPFFLFPYAADKSWKNLSAIKKAKADYNECKKVTDYISNNIDKGKYILTDFHTENTLNLQLSQYALFANREIVLRFLPEGTFSYKKFDDLVKTGRVEYFIGLEGKSPGVFLTSSLSAFQQDTLIGEYQVYKFR